MTGLLVFLVGLFGVPLALLWWGHRVRRMSRPAQRAFWGAIIGHCVAGLAASIFGMFPPEAWSEGDAVRGFFGFFSLLAFPVGGGLIGYVTGGARPARGQES